MCWEDLVCKSLSFLVTYVIKLLQEPAFLFLYDPAAALQPFKLKKCAVRLVYYATWLMLREHALCTITGALSRSEVGRMAMSKCGTMIVPSGLVGEETKVPCKNKVC